MAPTQGRDTRLPQEDAALKRLRPTMVLCPGVAGGAHAWGGCEKRHTVPCFPFTTLVTHCGLVCRARRRHGPDESLIFVGLWASGGFTRVMITV